MSTPSSRALSSSGSARAASRLSRAMPSSTGFFACFSFLLAARALGHAHIELRAARVLPAAHDLLEGPLDEPQGTRDVVGGARRQDAERDAAPDHAPRDLADGAIATGDDDQVSVFLERLFPAVLFRRPVTHIVAMMGEESAQLLRILAAVLAGAGVVDQ